MIFNYNASTSTLSNDKLTLEKLDALIKDIGKPKFKVIISNYLPKDTIFQMPQMGSEVNLIGMSRATFNHLKKQNILTDNDLK